MAGSTDSFSLLRKQNPLPHFHLSFSIFHFTGLSAGTYASQYFHLKMEFWINLLICFDSIVHPCLNINTEIQPKLQNDSLKQF
jgi:hypothetical protein